MKIGTKSLLFGVHQIFLHPLFVAAAWWKLYGFPCDPRLWVAFVVHDWGYWGCPNMDGPEGEKHPELGAKIMHYLFDKDGFHDFWFMMVTSRNNRKAVKSILEVVELKKEPSKKYVYRKGNEHKAAKYTKWYRLVKFHSRFLAKQYHHPPSKLCFADKLAIVFYPAWLYKILGKASGEVYEYMKLAQSGKYDVAKLNLESMDSWLRTNKEYMRRYVAEHVTGKEDHWTPSY